MTPEEKAPPYFTELLDFAQVRIPSSTDQIASDANIIALSQAVSLKRIADALEKLEAGQFAGIYQQTGQAGPRQ